MDSSADLLFNLDAIDAAKGDHSIHHLLKDCRWEETLAESSIVHRLLDEEEFNSMDEFECDLLLQCGIASLLAFVQDNFSGPQLNSTTYEPPECSSALLSVDGEEINPNVRHPALLLVSQKIFHHLYGIQPIPMHGLWLLRHVVIHQRCLEEFAATLYAIFNDAAECVRLGLSSFSPKDKTLASLEVAQGYLLYKRVHRAEEILNQIEMDLGLSFRIDGALGVRTKFQQNAIAQLTLRIDDSKAENWPAASQTHSGALPTILRLDDDLRLEQVKFSSEEENQDKPLAGVLQNLLFTKIKYLHLARPKDELTNEELQPYMMTLLSQTHGPWMTRIQALLTNIRLEATHKRTVERSLKQCEELLNLIDTVSEGDVKGRFSYIFSSFMQPRWNVEMQLAELMVSLGLIKSALDLYLRLNAWEDVIFCYTALQQRHKAAKIIQQEIVKKPSVKLYCLLGDATDDVSCYERAWKMSNEQSGRAQRHWGYYYFAKRDYANAILHLERSLEINSLQEVVWLRLGYAALTLEQWEKAAKAYRRYTQLEPLGFESWNNLAKAYIKLGEKSRAHKVLQEALKCNFNSWKVWENFLLVSVDVGAFEDAINAYSRLLELKDRYYDEEIVQILVQAIVDNVRDSDGVAAGRLKKKALQMLGHLSAKEPMNGTIWEQSAHLSHDEPLVRAQKLQKAYRGHTQTSSDWAKDPKMCERIVKLCLELCEASIQATEMGFNDGQKSTILSQLSSARLTSQSCLKAAASADSHDGLQESIKELQASVEILTELTKKHL